MLELCPNAIMLQYVNPMAINTWAIAKKYPEIKQVGLCHSVQHTVNELASDLKVPVNKIRYLSAGINHVAYFLKFEEIIDNQDEQITQAQMKYYMPLKDKNSENFRIQIIKIIGENIRHQLLEHGINHEIIDSIFIRHLHN